MSENFKKHLKRNELEFPYVNREAQENQNKKRLLGLIHPIEWLTIT